MSALVRFCYVAAGDTFTTSELRGGMAEALAVAADQCPLGSVRDELSKLRGKGLLEKLPHSRRYRLLPIGYRIWVVFLKLFHKIYAPLTAGLLSSLSGRPNCVRSQIDSTRQVVPLCLAALDQLVAAVGIKVGLTGRTENKILVGDPDNGLRFFADCAAKKWPLRGSSGAGIVFLRGRNRFVLAVLSVLA
jgi:hypothetical protein